MEGEAEQILGVAQAKEERLAWVFNGRMAGRRSGKLPRVSLTERCSGLAGWMQCTRAREALAYLGPSTRKLDIRMRRRRI